MLANVSVETTKTTNAFMHSQNRKNQMNTENIMRWNTGAYYTEHGQRIAAIEVDGGVFMSDKDRGLHYFFPDCPFYQSEIMRRYNYNENGKYSSPGVDAFGQWALIEIMHKGQ
jgi:hypothetical protein